MVKKYGRPVSLRMSLRMLCSRYEGDEAMASAKVIVEARGTEVLLSSKKTK